MASDDDNLYDDDMTQDDGYSDFDDEDADDSPAKPVDRGLRSQISNPFSTGPRPGAPSTSGSGPVRSSGAPLTGDEARRGYGSGPASSSGSGAPRTPGSPPSSSSSPFGGSRPAQSSGSGTPPPAGGARTFGSSSSSTSGPVRPGGAGSGSSSSSTSGPVRPGGAGSGSGQQRPDPIPASGSRDRDSRDRDFDSRTSNNPASSSSQLPRSGAFSSDRDRDRRDEPRGSTSSSTPGRGTPSAQPPSRDEGRPGGSSSRSEQGAKPPNKPGDKSEGGGLGAKVSGFGATVGGLFKRGGEDKAKPAAASRPGAPSAPGSRPGGPSAQSTQGGMRSSSASGAGGRPSAQDAPKSGLGKIFGGLKLPFGRKGGDDKPAARPGEAARPAARPSSTDPRGTQSMPPARPSASGPGAASATRQQAAGRQQDAADPQGGGGLFEAGGRFLKGMFGAGAQPQSRTRRDANNNRVEIDTSWLSSLDTRLDLIGIALMLGGIVLALSALSPSPGSVPDSINHFIRQLTGWGAPAVHVLMLITGGFLLYTRFGDEPPKLDAARLFGWLLLYLAGLTMFQYIEALNPLYQGDMVYFSNVIQRSYLEGRGGGFIGMNIHLFMIQNIGEVAGFALLVGWALVSVMLITRTSAAELIMLLVSLYTGFRITWTRRAQQRRAERHLLLEQRQIEAARIAVQRPAVAELGSGGSAGALPASTGPRQQALPLDDAGIPIRMGGQLVSAQRGAAPQVQSSGIGGLMRRLPGMGKPDSQSASANGEKRGLFGRRTASTSGTALTPAPAVFAPPPGAHAMQQPAALQTPAMPNNAPQQHPVGAPAPTYAPQSQQPAPQPVQSTPQPTVHQPFAEAPPITVNQVIQPPRAPEIHRAIPKREWQMPTYQSVLSPGSKADYDRKALVERANVIAATLESFGAPGKVVEINTGPVITQFGVEPGHVTVRDRQTRVKVSAIAQLDKDLQLALGARSIRIEAPVPGKGFVGIEVPNDTPMTVSLRDVMESPRFRSIRSPLAMALGEAVDGTPIAADLTSMPHLLVAGTTGSGKSVMVNAIIASLLLRNTPDQVKFIMVDPKRVELTGYNGIPHLIAPVVVDVEKIISVLKWVTREMDSRYKKFSVAGARNIEDFNRNRNPDTEMMPYIVVIIDELADLMMLAPEEAERYVTRVAAMARATGIHLVIATQRPSADVVTGLIKANFPARIAFAVASNVDSRVIIDQPGAEKLLGRGDMLYVSGDSPAPQRLQGVFVSDKEINSIVRYWKAQGEAAPRPSTDFGEAGESDRLVTAAPPRQASSLPTFGGQQRPAVSGAISQPGLFDEDDEDDDIGVDEDGVPDDELYNRAVELVRRQGGASVSLLQRKMRIGYARAARIIDTMEERGVVGPSKEGSSKQRDVLLPKE